MKSTLADAQGLAASTHHEHVVHSRRNGVNDLLVFPPPQGTATSQSFFHQQSNTDTTNINQNGEIIPSSGRRHDHYTPQNRWLNQAANCAMDGLQEGRGVASVDVSHVLGILDSADNIAVTTRNRGAPSYSFIEGKTTAHISTEPGTTPTTGSGEVRKPPPFGERRGYEEAGSTTKASASFLSCLPSGQDQSQQHSQQICTSDTALLEFEGWMAMEPTPIGPMGVQRTQLVPHVPLTETDTLRYGTQISTLVATIFRQQPIIQTRTAGIKEGTVGDEGDFTWQHCRFKDKQGSNGIGITYAPGKSSRNHFFSFNKKLSSGVTPSPTNNDNQTVLQGLASSSTTKNSQDSFAAFQAEAIDEFDGRAMNVTMDAIDRAASHSPTIQGGAHMCHRQKKPPQTLPPGWRAGHPTKTRRLKEQDQPPRLAEKSLGRKENYDSDDVLVDTDDNDQHHGRFRHYQNDQWKERFEELLEFHRRHGHCLVSHNSKNNQLAHVSDLQKTLPL